MRSVAAFRTLVRVQWQQQRVELTLIALTAAITGPASLWVGHRFGASDLERLVNSSQVTGPMGALLAVVGGVLLATRPWMLDAQTKHTYALSLPLSRPHFAYLRAAAGLALCLVPAAAFLIGALLTVRVAPRVEWLRAFPVGLSARFLLATATAFAIGYAIQYGLGRRAARWLLIVGFTITAFELFGQMAVGTSLTEPLFRLLGAPLSPLGIFFGQWSLFDV
jgi:hypothetical protein